MRVLGWNCMLSPAVECIDGRRGSGSGGLLCCCAQHHGLGVIEGVECVIVPGQAACCLHSGFSKAGDVLVDVYLHDKIGIAAANLDILFLVAERVRMIGRPYVIAGDFNNEPDDLRAAGVMDWFDATIVGPGVGTCAPAGRQVDFFLVPEGLEAVAVHVHPEVPLSPHSVVCLQIAATVGRPKMRVLPVPRLFPDDRPD
eukprot:7648385-Pyramimonas_sp.AAC.1